MTNLYRRIDDHEFRGAAFFEAEFVPELEWIPTTPLSYKGAFYAGDKLIVERLTDVEFRVCAVNVDGEWRNPIPTYEEVAQAYHVRLRQIALRRRRVVKP